MKGRVWLLKRRAVISNTALSRKMHILATKHWLIHTSTGPNLHVLVYMYYRNNLEILHCILALFYVESRCIVMGDQSKIVLGSNY